MKLVVIDNDGLSHVLIRKLELEHNPYDIGNTVLDFVSFIDTECSGTVGRGESR